MAITTINFQCPIFRTLCLTESCVAYESRSQQKFKDLINNAYISVDKLKPYLAMTKEERVGKIQREVTIWRTCRYLGTIINIETMIDVEIPEEAMK